VSATTPRTPASAAGPGANGPGSAPPVVRAAPDVDADSAPSWAALRAGRVALQRCTACGRVRFPPMPGCPHCGATGFEEVEASGGGTVYSWVRVHRTADERFAADVPYTIAAVDLDEGCRMFGRLEPPAEPSIGARVGFAFVHHGDWTELRFAGADGPAGAAGEPAAGPGSAGGAGA